MKLILGLILLIAGSQECFAYLDPGTGSILIQSLIAAVAASALIIKTYWYRIKTFFGKNSPATGNKEDKTADDENQDIPN